MGLATTLYTSLTGMDTSSQMLNVAGNNIANVNTTSFKRSRISFQTQISQTLRNGSAPSSVLGGTNPAQVGLGTRLGSIRRDFSSGALQPTGVNTDMAIEGNGFFIVNANGTQRYTRDGGFTLDRDFTIVSPGNGGIVQGFSVDSDFNVIEGVLGNISVPVGIMTLAEPTEAVNLAGNLNAGGDAATQGSIIDFERFYSDAAATTVALSTTSLSSIYDVDGNNLFATGDIITLDDATKGGAKLPNSTFEIGVSNTTSSDAFGITVAGLMTFIQDIFGLETAFTGSAAGVTITAGAIKITGNEGLSNDLVLDDGNFILNASGTPSLPVMLTKAQSSDGEANRTTFVIYDSLGNPMTVDISIVLENKDNTGTQWRFFASSSDDSDLARAIGTGTLSFDTNGQLLSVGDGQIVLNRNGIGSTTPQSVSVDFIDPFGSVSALFDVRSQVSAISQDGSPIGTLEDFTVDGDGTIVGVFSNSLLRTLGRIPMAMFANNEGLEEIGANLYRASSNSGIATVVNATSGGSGKIIGRALELSNVDLAEEFINLITASTGFSANSRVLSTSDRLIQELLATIR